MIPSPVLCPASGWKAAWDINRLLGGRKPGVWCCNHDVLQPLSGVLSHAPQKRFSDGAVRLIGNGQGSLSLACAAVKAILGEESQEAVWVVSIMRIMP